MSSITTVSMFGPNAGNITDTFTASLNGVDWVAPVPAPEPYIPIYSFEDYYLAFPELFQFLDSIPQDQWAESEYCYTPPEPPSPVPVPAAMYLFATAVLALVVVARRGGKG